MIVSNKELEEALENQKNQGSDDLSDILDNDNSKESSEKVEVDTNSGVEQEQKTFTKKRSKKPTIVLSEQAIDVITDTDKKSNDIELEIHQEEKKEDTNIEERGQDEVLLETAYYLNEFLDLGISIDEDTLKKYTPKQIFEGVYESLEESILEKYKDDISKNTYKTDEAYLLDEFITNGGDIDSFIEYYNSQKLGIDKLDAALEEIKSYAPEQYIYVNLLENGFSQEEALEYIDNLISDGLLEKEYQKEIKKLERNIQVNKQKLIQDSLSDLTKKTKEQAIQEEQEIEKGKTEIANYLSKIDNFFGYPLGEKDKDRIFDFITRKNENGLTELDMYLQSNKNILIQSVFALYGNEILKSIETYANERGKRKFFEKLPSSPLYTNKKQGINQVNFEKLNEF